MRILELFSGYGTASFALKQLGIPYECVGYSDIDKYANKCFQQNHGGLELGDATKINPNDLEDFDLLTAGFPCQAFSVAGKMLGELDTRGTLFNEIIRIAEIKKPRYMLLENVKGLISKRHKETYEKIKSELSRIGYYVKINILNTKDYGIPQNRERIWFVCFKRKHDFEKFRFPEKEELRIFLKDILEDSVDEKYYLSEKQIKKLKEHCGKKNSINADIINCIGTCFGRSGSLNKECESFARTNKALMIGNLSRYKINSERSMPFKEEGISWALTGDCGVGVLEPVRLFGIFDKDGKRHQAGSVWDKNKISPTLDSMQGGYRQPIIVASRGRYNINGEIKQNLEPRLDNITNSITSVQKDNYLIKNFRLRKLTPKECFRLQGFLNDEINLDGLSNTQRYKLAGNGQSVNVVKAIFKQMFA